MFTPGQTRQVPHSSNVALVVVSRVAHRYTHPMNKVLPLFEGSPKLDVFDEVAPELWVIPVDSRTAMESLADIGGEARGSDAQDPTES